MGERKRHLVAGFSGGLASAVALQPLDLIKTRVQSGEKGVIGVLRGMESWTELWRGTVPSAIRTSLGSAMYLTTLHVMRSTMTISKQTSLRGSSKLPKLSALENLGSGMLARGIVGFITMPITIIKVRFESNMYHYSSIAEATQIIWKHEGLKGFFRGVGATCLRDAPYAGLYVSFYEQLKISLPKLLNWEGEFDVKGSALINSSSAIVASILATSITAPFDKIKTNMQLKPEKYFSFMNTLKLLVSEDWKRLFDGVGLRLLRKAGSAGIAWCIYEELVKL